MSSFYIIAGIAADFPIHVILHYDDLRRYPRAQPQPPSPSSKSQSRPDSNGGFAQAAQSSQYGRHDQKTSHTGDIEQQFIDPTLQPVDEETTKPFLDVVEPPNERSDVFVGSCTDAHTGTGPVPSSTSLVQPTCNDEATEKVSTIKSYSAAIGALTETVVYMRGALLAPLILVIIIGIPLLFATFTLLQKTGQYLIIMAIVSYIVSVSILPGILAFVPHSHKFMLKCRSTHCTGLTGSSCRR